MEEELRLTGETRALYTALMAVISSHPEPSKAAKRALYAIEDEIVGTLNRSGVPEPWLGGMQDLQARLSSIFADKYSV